MALVISLFFFIVWRAFAIARHAETRKRFFGAYLAYGLGLLFGLQAFINIGVNMGDPADQRSDPASDELRRFQLPGERGGGGLVDAHRS